MTIEQALIGLSCDAVPICSSVRLTARSTLPGRLHSIIVDGATARAFELCNLRIGRDSIMSNASPIALSMFATAMPRWPNAFQIVPEQELADIPRLWTGGTFAREQDIRVELCNRYGVTQLPFRGALVVSVINIEQPEAAPARSQPHFFKGELEAGEPVELRYQAMRAGAVKRAVLDAGSAEHIELESVRIEHAPEQINARAPTRELAYIANDVVVVRIFNKSGRRRPYACALILEHR